MWVRATCDSSPSLRGSHYPEYSLIVLSPGVWDASVLEKTLRSESNRHLPWGIQNYTSQIFWQKCGHQAPLNLNHARHDRTWILYQFNNLSILKFLLMLFCQNSFHSWRLNWCVSFRDDDGEPCSVVTRGSTFSSDHFQHFRRLAIDFWVPFGLKRKSYRL